MADPIFGTLKELSVHMAKVQQHQVDGITEETPVLNTIPFEQATHDLWNVASVLQNISGGGFVKMNAPLSQVKVDRGLTKVDLEILGGEVFVPQDTAVVVGGPAAWFSKNEFSIMRNFGMSAEEAIIYNNLRQYALDNGKKLNAGASGNVNYSLLAVRWVPGEVCGLYSPKLFSHGELVKAEALNGGNLTKDPTTKVNGYGMQYKGYMGMQLLNSKCVAGIFNITDSNKPTALQVDGLLEMVRADKKRTYLYCHPHVQGILGDVGKGGAFRMGVGDKDVSREIEKWNGVPIVTSYQFYAATESVVSFS